ncbi:MAG: lytic transglycosylase domain-containing protein [Bacteroidales bacterium]|nr:lytic transglycosylase domain-containing protein [Bacteroidales bacterium]
MNKRTVAILSVFAVISLLIGFYSFSPSIYTLDEKDEREPPEHKSESPYFPSEVNFAEEPMPIELYDVHEALERELIVNMNFHSSTIQYLKRSNRYFPVIEKILAENGVPDDFKYLSLIESDFMNRVSPKGATGFWQFMKDAAKDYGLEVNSEVDERYHLEKSTVAACKYLKNAYSQFGNWTMAAASYNMGTAGLSKQSKQQMNSDYYNLLLHEETMRYLYRIVAVKLILSNPESYGFYIPENERYNPIQYTEEEIKKPVDDWAVFAKEHGTNYKYLKALNPWLRDTKLLNPTKKTYVIKIPKNG